MANLTIAATDLNVGPLKPACLSGVMTVKASTALTTAYSGFTTDWVPVIGRWSRGSFLLDWTFSTDTSMNVWVETSPTGGAATTGYADDEAAAQAAGVAAVTPAARQYTAANYTAAGTGSATVAYIRIPLDLTDVAYVRVKALKAGGGTSTLVAKFIAGRGDT
jgi:hypothetical protein